MSIQQLSLKLDFLFMWGSRVIVPALICSSAELKARELSDAGTKAVLRKGAEGSAPATESQCMRERVGQNAVEVPADGLS